MTYGLRLLDDALVETCDECGFDSRHIADELAAASSAFESLALLQQRAHFDEPPQPGTWSGAEYTAHVVGAVNLVLQHVGDALGTAGVSDAADLAGARDAAMGCIASITRSQREVACPFMGAPTDVAGLLLHLLHDVEHHVLDVRRGLAVIALARGADVVTVER